MGAAAEAFDFEIGVAGVESVTQRRGGGVAPESRACFFSRLPRGADRRPYTLRPRVPPKPGPRRRRLSRVTLCPWRIKAPSAAQGKSTHRWCLNVTGNPANRGCGKGRGGG